MKLPVILLCAAITSHANPTQPMKNGPKSLGYTLNFIDLQKHPLAVCNDGSAAAYYLHKGSDPSRWVLHQQGGWWCWDDYSCQVRWDHFANHTTEFRTLMSTRELAKLTDMHDTFNGEKNTGLMQHDQATNPMWNATKVFLAYCSSDAHAGNRSSSVEPGVRAKWHFRGKEIVTAVVAELAEMYGLTGAKQFVLTGGSAGGMATINNGDYVAELVRKVSPKVQYVAMPDSGYFLDVMPHRMCTNPDSYECKCAAQGYPSSGAAAEGFLRDDGHAWTGRGQTLAQQAQGMYVYTGGVVDESCAKHYGRWGAWKCYLGQYAAPHLENPTLFLQNQIDEWQGFMDGFFEYATDAADFEYAQWFRIESSTNLRDSTQNSNVYVFAPNCYHHGLSYNNIFWEVQVNGWSSASLLDGILNGGAPPQLVLDGCKGLPCSPDTTAPEHTDCQPVSAAPEFVV